MAHSEAVNTQNFDFCSGGSNPSVPRETKYATVTRCFLISTDSIKSYKEELSLIGIHL